MRRALVMVGIIALAGPFSQARAATVLALTVEELTGTSDRVIRGRVVSQETEAKKGLVFRLTTLDVIEDLAGEGPSRVVVRQLGGESGPHGVHIEGNAVFEVGEEVVVFVSIGRTGSSLVHVVGLSLGKFRVEQVEEEAIAVRNMTGVQLIRLDEARAVIESRLSLDELRSRVRAADSQSRGSSRGDGR